jgi:tetratricopeptide (TPR) repeat protein
VLRDFIRRLIRSPERSARGEAARELRRLASERGLEAALAFGRGEAGRRPDPVLQRELGGLLIDAARDRYARPGAGDEAGALALYREAVASLRASLAAQPDPDVHRACGIALRELGDLTGAHLAFEAAHRMRPHHARFGADLAFSFQCLGDTARALETYEAALAAQPDDANAHAGYALSLLGAGDFARGWDEYEWRLRVPGATPGAAAPYPYWAGEALGGKTLLVRSEQGIGDEIMFASCLPQLLAQVARCVLECSRRLTGLFGRSFPGVRIIARDRSREPDWAALGRIDYQSAAGSLPRWLRRAAADFPGTPYLHADPARVAAWRERLGNPPGMLRVGIAWTGGLPGTLRAARSLALDALEPLFALPNARFVALELGDCSAELAAMQARSGARIDFWPGVAADPDEAAALACALDALVCVPTTMAHLAGALGRPVWVLVPGVATWRYLWQGERMPWYGSMRLLRRAPGIDTPALVAQARDALATLTRSAAPRPD